MLFEHGTNDDTIPYSSGYLAYRDAHTPKFFVTLEGSGHCPPFAGDATRAEARVATATTTDFIDLYLKNSPVRWFDCATTPMSAGTASLREADK